MPEHLRALVVILGLAVPVFWIAQRVLCPSVIDEGDFVRRRNLWFGITLAAFLSHNYWLFLAISTVLMLWGASPRRERNPMALFFFLLFAVPAFKGSLPGLGIFQHLFEVNHPRFLALFILLPAALRLNKDPTAPRLGRFAADWFLMGYLLLQVVLYFGATTLTQTMRAGFYLVVDMLLLYYVASRSVVDLRGFRDVAGSLGVALMVVAPIAVFEFGKHWLLFSPLTVALGLYWDAGNYLGREDLLRAVGPAGHALVLGYALAVGLGFWVYLHRTLPTGAWWVGAVVLFAGLIAPVSRGPWVGAALIVTVAVATGQHAAPRIMRLLLAGAGIVLLLALTPYGEKLVEYLPFVGSVDEGNVSYRKRLFDVSLMVIAQNPLLGSPTFLSNATMEQMRQGQGIIDLVNSYLAITLSSGLIGLLLFSGIFAVSLVGVYAAMRGDQSGSKETELLGRSLLGILVGVLMMIATASSILLIPVVYWSLAGLSVAYASMVRRSPAVAVEESRMASLPGRAARFSTPVTARRPQGGG